MVYQDLTATAVKQADGRVLLTVGNKMPYAISNLALSVRSFGKFTPPTLAPGEAVTLLLPVENAPGVRERAVIRAVYTTHGGLKHTVLLTPVVMQGGK